MMRFKILILFFIYSHTVLAGAWVQEKGKGLNILAYQDYFSNQFWSPGGSLQNATDYKKHYVSNFLEYGLTDKTTIGLFISAFHVRNFFTGNHTVGEAKSVFLRTELYKSNYSVISLEAFFNALGPGARVDIPPQNSDLNTGQAIQFGTSGRILNRKNDFWFADVSLGLVQRYGPGSQARIIAQGGLKYLDDKLWFMLQSFNTFNTKRVGKPIFLEYNLFTLGPSVLWKVSDNYRVQLGYYFDVYGQNVGKGSAPFISLWYQFGA